MTEEKLEETTPEVKEENLPPDCHCEPVTDVTGVAIRSPSEEEQPDSEKSVEVEKLKEELESVRGQITRLEHERYLLSRGVPEEDLDYYAFKIEHMEGAKSDFAKAAKEYLKAHPVRRTAVSSGADLGAGSTRRPATSSELMNQLLRNR